MTERVIGLTIVAAGTSAPELAASLVAAYRGRSDVALANIIGSNIFNHPRHPRHHRPDSPIPVSAGIVHVDAWWMLGFAVVLFPMMWTRRSISRIEGGVLLAGYVIYLATLLRG